MRNIRLILEYDGTNYVGWQIQKRHRGKTIQGTVTKALQRILQEKINLIGSGRTDSGVHAKNQVANFRTTSRIPLGNLKKALNSILPKDIAVKQIKQVALDFHSRFSATSKAYRYVILNRSCHDPFLRSFAYFYPFKLNIKLMRKEAKALLGRHNFAAFRASVALASGGQTTAFRSAGKKKNPVKTIKKIRITKIKDLIYIDVTADGFLYNMVRNIVGTLIDIGRGRLAKGGLKKILNSQDRRLAGFTAPAKGLFLTAVRY